MYGSVYKAVSVRKPEGEELDCLQYFTFVCVLYVHTHFLPAFVTDSVETKGHRKSLLKKLCA